MDPMLFTQTLKQMETGVDNICSNESLDSDHQNEYGGDLDSAVDALPTEGYCVFDSRPISIRPSSPVCRLLVI